MCYSLRYSRKKKRRKRSLLVFSSLSLFFSSPLVVERTRRKKFSRLLICWGAKNSKNKFKKFGRAFFFLSVSSLVFSAAPSFALKITKQPRCTLSLSVQVALRALTRAQTQKTLPSQRNTGGGRKKNCLKKIGKKKYETPPLPSKS
jgi:hypothetical protein